MGKVRMEKVHMEKVLQKRWECQEEERKVARVLGKWVDERKQVY